MKMKAYKCDRCGRSFDTLEFKVKDETISEFINLCDLCVEKVWFIHGNVTESEAKMKRFISAYWLVILALLAGMWLGMLIAGVLR